MGRETIGPDAYSDVKSHRTGMLKDAPKIDFRGVDTVALYCDLGFSGESVAIVAGVTKKTVYDRVRRAGRVVRPLFENPEHEARRIEGLRKVRINPQRRAEIYAQVQSPEAIEKRRQSLLDKWQDDPFYRENRLRGGNSRK